MSDAAPHRRPADPLCADRMVLDRVRAACRTFYLAARAPALFAVRLTHRRVPPPSPARVRRLLVVRTDGLGKMALTAAALQDLRAHFNRAVITVAAPAGALELLRAHPAVDRRCALDHDRRLPATLVGRFDLAIDFTPDESLRGALLVAQSRARFRAGFSAAGREAFFNIPGPTARRDRHVVDLNRDLLAALGAAAPTARPALHVTPIERDAVRRRLAALGAAPPFVTVHPGAHDPSQRWAVEHFATVISRLTERTAAACIVSCGPGEEGLGRRVCAATPDALSFEVGSVRSVMALIDCSDLFIGNISGPLHVAGALGVPTVPVTGPIDPEEVAAAAETALREAIPMLDVQ